MTNITYRQPTNEELFLLNRMLGANFQGSKELKQQLDGVLVHTLDEKIDNYSSLSLKVTNNNTVNIKKRVPVIAQAYDSDGVLIEALLHVVDGKLNELEVIKADGTPILNRPDVSDYKVALE